jgi:hypothetical protein
VSWRGEGLPEDRRDCLRIGGGAVWRYERGEAVDLGGGRGCLRIGGERGAV